ncbi:MAG: efflux RND transporter periplasmic adaptor subunit [Rhodoferax sp.]|nr:efflux RND transporter periplasmic adaptor subunit [Rhodoferax sp.]
MRHSTTKWIVASAVIAALALAGVRVLFARSAQKASLEAQQTAAQSRAVVELGPGDLVQVQVLSLQQGVALSGSIKAVSSAFVKARVAGELQGLTLREGDPVKVGDVLAKVDSTEYQARVNQAQQQAEAAKAQVDIAKRNFDNNRSLVDRGFISKTALDTSLASLSAAEANYRAAQAGADVATKALADTVLRAPITGVVSQRLAQPGERVGVDARIVEIVDLSRLELEASVSAADAPHVRLGQNAQLTLEGVAEPVTAKVVRINPSAAVGSRAMLVYLALPPHPGLRHGLFAQGSLATGSTQGLAVPLSAVRTDKPEPYVQVVRDGLVQHQGVTLGARGVSGASSASGGGQTMVALTGVPESASLLAGSVGSLRAGTQVKLTQNAQNAK